MRPKLGAYTMWRMRRAWFVGCLLVVLVSVAAASSGTSPNSTSTLGPCKTRSAGRLVDFISAFNNAQIGKLDSIVATGSAFRWYFVQGDAGQRLDDTSHDRSTLRGYFTARAAQHEQLALISATLKQREKSPTLVDYTAELLRQATDVPATRYLAKGAFMCDAQRVQLIVLAMGPH